MRQRVQRSRSSVRKRASGSAPTLAPGPWAREPGTLRGPGPICVGRATQRGPSGPRLPWGPAARPAGPALVPQPTTARRPRRHEPSTHPCRLPAHASRPKSARNTSRRTVPGRRANSGRQRRVPAPIGDPRGVTSGVQRPSPPPTLGSGNGLSPYPDLHFETGRSWPWRASSATIRRKVWRRIQPRSEAAAGSPSTVPQGILPPPAPPVTGRPRHPGRPNSALGAPSPGAGETRMRVGEVRRNPPRGTRQYRTRPARVPTIPVVGGARAPRALAGPGPGHLCPLRDGPAARPVNRGERTLPLAPVVGARRPFCLTRFSLIRR